MYFKVFFLLCGYVKMLRFWFRCTAVFNLHLYSRCLFFFFVAVDSTPDLGAFFVCSSILLLLPLLCNENTSKKTSVVVVCFMVPLKPGKGVALMIPVAVPNLNWNANFS